MSRPVSEVVADLRETADSFERDDWPATAEQLREAAALLERLDAQIDNNTDELMHFHNELRAIHDLLPPCPTCGGKGKLDKWEPTRNGGAVNVHKPCPDCLDTPGHVSPSRLVALWEAVWDTFPERNFDTVSAWLVHLRSVKPT